MRISLLVPTPNFLEELAIELRKLGHTVLVNQCDMDCEVIIGMSISQLRNIARFKEQFPHIPLITYNWDWYDHVNKTTPEWRVFTDYMRKSLDVWSASEITAQKCEKDTGVKSSTWFYAYVLPNEWKEIPRDQGYIIQASRNDPSKRFDWFEKAATELGIPFKSYHPGVNSREDYIQAIQNCSFVVVSSREESLGTLSALEGGFNQKPVLIADFEGAKEVWGDNAWYFPKDDYEAYKAQMKWLWENRKTSKEVQQKIFAQVERIEQNFTPKAFARKVHVRLIEIL